MSKPTPKTKPEYHRSTPNVPEGLQRLDLWANEKGLTPVCVRKWGWAGKLSIYRVPGYGLRSFVKISEANKLIVARQDVPNLAK